MSPEPTIGERWNNRALFGLLWPLILEQLLAISIGVVATLMVSHLGEYAVSAVNIIDSINSLLIVAFTALCTGGSVVVSQYIGRKDYENSSLAAKQLIYSIMVISLFVMTFTIFFRYQIVRVIYGNLEADVMTAAAVYLFYMGLSYPLLALNSACSALFRASGNSNIPMRIAIMANIINIAGCALFIFVLNLGVMGAALAAFICRIAAAIVSTIILYGYKTGPISILGLFRVRLVFSMIKKILNIGVPSGIESSMFMIGRLMTQRIFTFFGTAALAANAATNMINSLAFMPGMAFGMAMLVIAGQCIGAGDYEEAKRQIFKLMKLTYITLNIICLGILIFMKPMISVFNLSPEAQDMAVIFLRIYCFATVISWPASFCLPNALRAAGDARYVMISSFISMWIVRVISAYVMAFIMGVGPPAVWIATGADFILRGIIFLHRWMGGKWQQKRVID